jgi:amino acid transporter
MFPQEGSLYVWTQKALGPFWGFFAGFCAWWPGILVMVATGDAVVTIWQFIDTGGLPKAWQQGLVILAVLWFSALMATLRLRMTQSYANVAVVFYGAGIFVIGLAGVLWLIGSGHSATGGWGTASNWSIHSTQWTWFGFVILALLGIEVPLNMGVEIVHMRAIKKYLFWGSIVVMVAYLWATLGTMLALPASKSVGATTDILRAVQVGFFGSHAFAVVVALVLLWFFVANTIVYNYSFSRLLFVSGLEQRMPKELGTVSAKRKVPVHAIILQTVLSSIFVIAIFNPWVSGDNNQRAYWLFQAAVTVIWCVSMVLLFADIFLVKRAFPAKFEEVRTTHPYLLYASGVLGILASAFGAYVTFRSPWTSLFSVQHWRIWLGTLCGVSIAAAIVIYAISEFMRRREAPTPTLTPAG